MAAIDLTTTVRSAVAALPVSPAATFIHGSEGLHNLLGDSVESFPVVFLNSPRSGSYKNQQSGAVIKVVKVAYFVANKTKLDENPDTVRTVLNEMHGYAISIFKAIIAVASFHNVDDAIYTEAEGVFDSNLTGVYVEMDVELTDIDAGC